MKVKITVIKKLSTKDVYGNSSPCRVAANNEPECPVFNVGDEFVAKDDGFLACKVLWLGVG